MPKKRKPEPVPENARIVEPEPGEFLPPIVASKHFSKIVSGVSPKTTANWRSEKRGPKFYMIGGSPYYKTSDLIEFFTQNPVETFNNDV